MTITIPTGNKATVKILYGAYNTSNLLTVNSSNQTALTTQLADGMTNAQVHAALKEVTLTNQSGTLTLGSSTGNIYIARVSAVITGYPVTHTLTNVTKTSGAATAGGSDYTAQYAGATGYTLPAAITVTIGGVTKTAGTDYTWTQATGTLTIPAAKLTGAVVVTVNSAAAAPTSVTISGTYHYYPGETISLTATPTGGNGPKTYQWYHGGKADENAIDGATSATYSKASCEVGDAGAYYCKVTCGGSLSTWGDNGNAYNVKIMQFYLKNSSGADISNAPLTRGVDANHASIMLSLTGGTTYNFRVTDGCNNWYGNNNTMTSSNCTNWTMPDDADAKMTTGLKTANYTFNFDFTNGLLGSQMKVSIVYPGGNQAADKVIYWDNSVLNWEAGSQWYRIGKSDHHNKTQMTLVSGTTNLYKVTTTEYNGFEYWHIANNQGEGTGNLFWTKYSSDATKAITHAMAFEGAPVTADAVTVTPTTSSAIGETDDNNNCYFYTYGMTTGMKSWTVTKVTPEHGTLNVTYTNTSGTANQAVATSPSTTTVAHTCVLTLATTPAEGYELSSLTVNGADPNDGSNSHIVLANSTVAATFSLINYNVTYSAPSHGSYTIKVGDGTASSESKTATMGQTVTLAATPATGYSFGSWTVTKAGGGTVTVSNNQFTMPADAVTVTATFTLNSHTLTWDFDGGSTSATAGTQYTAGGTVSYGAAITYPGNSTMSKTGYVFSGWSTSAATMPDEDLTITAQWAVDCPAAASGQTVYKFVVKSGLTAGNICSAKDTPVDITSPANLTTLTGGTLQGLVTSSSMNNLQYTNSGGIQYNNGDAGVLILNLDCALQTGDLIRYVNYSSGNSKYNYLRHTSNSTSSDQLQLKASQTAGSVQELVVPAAFNGKKVLYIVSGSNATAVSSIEIIRPYVVTLNASTNGGKVGGTNTATMYFGQSDPQALPHATKTDYYFNGWFANASSGDAVADPYTATGSTTLYAQFDDCSSLTGTIYKFQVKTGLTNATSGTSGSFDINTGNYFSTLLGGTATGYDSNGSKMSIVNNNAISINDNSNAYITVNLDCALKAGDIIKTTISGSKSGIKLTSTSSTTSLQNISYGTNVETPVPASLVGQKAFRILRQDSDCGGISYFEITRPDCSSITPTLTYSPTTLCMGTTETGTATLDTKGSTGAVTYSSSDASVVQVNATTGAITAKKAGTATITASIAAGGGKCAAEATCDITVMAGIVVQAFMLNTGSWNNSTISTYDPTNITGLSGMTAHGVTTGTGGKANLTVVVSTEADYDEDKYMELGFTVANGKELHVTGVTIPVQPVSSNTNNFRVVFLDATGNEVTFSKTNLTAGSIGNITYSGTCVLRGAVKMRIYAWGWTNGYRFGSPVGIQGTIEANSKQTPVFTWTTKPAATVNAGGQYAVDAAMTTGDGIFSFTILESGEWKHVTKSGNRFTGYVDAPASATTVTIRLSSTETATYAARTEDYQITVTRCVDASPTANKIPVSTTFESKYWQTTDVGWVQRQHGGATINSGTISALGSAVDGYTHYYNSNANYYCFHTELATTHLRLYTHGTAVTLSDIYINKTAFASGTPSVSALSDYTVTYDDGDATSSSVGYVDVLLDEKIPAGYYGFIRLSGNCHLVGLTIYTSSSSAATISDKSGISWAGGAPGTVNANVGSVVQYQAQKQTSFPRTMADVLYTSSNTSYATVDAEGKVTVIGGAGQTVTIKAQLPETGCYKASSELSYTINITSCSEPAGTVSITAGEAQKCAGASVTLTLTGHQSGSTVNWYRQGTTASQGTGASLTTTTAGTYYAVSTGSCDMRSQNEVTITNISTTPSATVLLDEYYIKQGRPIAPLEIFNISNATEIGVTPAIEGVSYTLSDGKVVMSGTPSSLTAGDQVITLRAKNDCGTWTENLATLTLHKLAAGGKNLAYVVRSSTEKSGGGWTEVSDDDISNSSTLRTALGNGGYTVTNVNGYHTTSRQEILAYYSQFDVVLITDFLNTQLAPNNKSSKANGYVNALGNLVDILPVLSMEAFVAPLSNWKIGGGSEPATAEGKQTTIYLTCTSHEIFRNLGAALTLDETTKLYKVQVLEASPSNGLQGFTADAAPEGFIFIATIQSGSDKLVVACERQTVPDARAIIFGLNSNDMNGMTAAGAAMVTAMADYLLKTGDAVSDCSLVFDNHNGNGKWSDTHNWAPNHNVLPDKTSAVRIEAPCTVDVTGAAASSIKIKNGAGSLTINANAELAVLGSIVEYSGTNTLVTQPLSSASMLTIKASSTGQGALAFMDKEGVTPAVVDFCFRASDRDASGQNRKYQYIGTPFTGVRSDVTYYGARMKYLDEVQAKWVSVKNNETIVPFRGYGFTQLTANEIKTQTGTLVSTTNRDLPVSYTASGLKGQNLLANSWMAPIDITAMTVDDFDNAEATIVFFHTGSGNEYAASSGEGASAGQYKSVPINSAQSLGYPYIPPMQGFMVAATADGKLTLDYERMVLQPALNDRRSTTRAYAPRRMSAYDDADEEPAADLGDPGLIRRQQRTVRIDVTNGVFTDELYIFSHPAFSTGFDNGWEAGKIISARYAPQLAVRSTEGDMSVLATPLMDSLYIAFRAGAEAENLITFESEETGLYMLDLRTNIAVPVETGYYYRFTDTSEELTTRFLLFRHDFSGGGDDPGREGTPTGLEVLRGHDGTLHLLLVDGASEAMVFDAAGRLVKRIGAGEEGLTLPQQGVYMVSVQTPSGIVTKKIIY